MERRNSFSGLASLNRAQQDLLQKTDTLSKLLEESMHILDQTKKELATTKAELQLEKVKHDQHVQDLENLINS